MVNRPVPVSSRYIPTHQPTKQAQHISYTTTQVIRYNITTMYIQEMKNKILNDYKRLPRIGRCVRWEGLLFRQACLECQGEDMSLCNHTMQQHKHYNTVTIHVLSSTITYTALMLYHSQSTNHGSNAHQPASLHPGLITLWVLDNRMSFHCA